MSTTDIVNRVGNATAAVFQGGGSGIAEAGTGPMDVVSGRDERKESPYYGEFYINQLIISNNGGPATRDVDGWLTYQAAGDVGLLHRDCVEVLEQKYPVRIEWVRLVADSGGAGRRRGALTVSAGYRAVDGPMTVALSGDGTVTPARGVNGGLPGALSRIECLTGDEKRILPIGQFSLGPDTLLSTSGGGGGGSGSPLQREPELVLRDIYERAVSLEAARETYGVVLVGDLDLRTLRVDHDATTTLRTTFRSGNATV
jgi:N-methylhydantoinase B